MEYEIKTTVNINDIWEALWGSDGIGMEWVSHVRTAKGEGIKFWDENWTPLPQPFRVYDIEERKWHDVSLEDLVKAYQIALDNKAMHCGDCLVADLDDPDACTGDILLQYAVFGELIYG